MKHRIIDAFFEGQCINAYEQMGAQLAFEKVEGVRFTLWARHAQKIQVIGAFNDWSCEGNFMKKIDDRGMWSVFVPHAKAGQAYKYRVTQADGTVVDKMDPFGYYSELRPNTASIIQNRNYTKWTDAEWVKNRNNNYDRPVNIYEMHLGAWKKKEDETVNYKKLAKDLVKYLKQGSYTHVEFMPLNEYPFDGSWGYQASGFFSATSRYGSVDDLKYLINAIHKANIGVIFDFVPVHFVMDNFALNKFDGTHMFEYPNAADAYSEWGTANFDLWKEEVRSFLMSAAAYWIDEFHVDGLRMDAISNAIFWQGNKNRGVNDGGLSFMKRMNFKLHEKFPGIMLIAEDSTDFPNVTKPTIDGGLGFDYKWDLGWMNDTLSYLKRDPIYRKYHHNDITFSMAYFYSERFLMPFSHDEVVHGKATIVNKMWGLYEDKFRQARALYTYMFTHPGKKLNFMGNELGMFREFDEEKENDWMLLEYPMHDSFHNFINHLSALYRKHPCLYEKDYDYTAFEWIDADNCNENLFSYMRMSEEETLVVILNMSPNTYHKHRFGVKEAGFYKEISNSEDEKYSGCGIINAKSIRAHKGECDFKPYYIEVDVAPFAGIILHHKNKQENEKTVEKKTTKKKKVEKK